VNPNLNLAAAQASLITLIQTSATEQADLQARIYSMYQLSIEASPGTLPTADYAGIDLDTYQAYIDGEVSAMTATVNAATTVPQLYSFDWRVEGDPNA
jgi:patatin-like phospholipase/acyl hydrolase